MYQKFLNMSSKPWPGPSATFAIQLKVKSKLNKLKTDDSLVGAPIFAPWSGPGKHQLPCWRVPAAVHMHGEGVPDTLMVFARLHLCPSTEPTL
jgi:hypothetical protein